MKKQLRAIKIIGGVLLFITVREYKKPAILKNKNVLWPVPRIAQKKNGKTIMMNKDILKYCPLLAKTKAIDDIDIGSIVFLN